MSEPMCRHYTAPIEAVWEACTEPDRLTRWLGEVLGTPAEGGTVSLVLAGSPAPVECTILRCDPPRRLVVTWQRPGEPASAVDVRLSPTGSGTALQLEHVAGTVGWADALTGLDRLLPDARELPGVAGAWPVATVLGETAVLTGERRYAAAPDAVWSAITDPARLRRWFAEVDIQDSTAAWTATFDNGKASGVVRACEPGRLLVTTWCWDHEESQSELTIQLEPDAGGTLLRLRQEDVEARPATGYAAGWYAYLAVLSTHLDGTDPGEADWNAEFSLARLAIGPAQRR